MTAFNYDTMAEVFPSRRYAKSQLTQYRRFARAAEAIRYCIEELPQTGLAGSVLEVDEVRFDGNAIRKLYDAPAYPLARERKAA